MAKILKKIGMVSLGCPKNRVDSEIILGDVRGKGFEITHRESEAEIIIINTCGFIDAAREESVETILRMAEYKKNGPCEILVVTGCLPQKYGDELLREIPEIDFLFGVSGLDRIGKILLKKQVDRERQPGNGRRVWVDGPDESSWTGNRRVLTTPRHSAYLKISEGCSSWCTFCIIPKLRGKFRSRPLAQLIKEAGDLARQGVRELNIVSQNTTLYGADLGMRHGLCRLLEELEKIDGIRWVRLLYCHPSLVDRELIRALAFFEKVCDYIDLPIQHSHNEILKKMGRRETEKDVRELLEYIRKEVPDITIRTEIIVGFPGEKSKHFNHLARFVEEMEFDRLGVFPYSREEGTDSAGMPGHLPLSEKEERREIILRLQEKISLLKGRSLIGTTRDVLVDGLGNGWGSVEDRSLPLLEGRMASQSPEIDGVVYLDRSDALPGEFRSVRIVDASGFDFVGRCD